MGLLGAPLVGLVELVDQPCRILLEQQVVRQVGTPDRPALAPGVSRSAGVGRQADWRDPAGHPGQRRHGNRLTLLQVDDYGRLQRLQERMARHARYSLRHLAAADDAHRERHELRERRVRVQDEVLRDPTNAAAGSIPYRRQIFDGDQITSSRGNFANYALYIQDAWRPTPRATVTLGLRVDWVKRHDDIFDIDTQDSVDIGPRLGLNYMLTSDQRNAVRVSYMRAHDAPSINQLLFAAGTNTLGFREEYDLDRNGSFETVFATAGEHGAQFGPHLRSGLQPALRGRVGRRLSASVRRPDHG